MISSDGRYMDNDWKTGKLSSETVLSKILKEQVKQCLASMEYNAVHWMEALYTNNYDQIMNLTDNGFPYLICFTSLEDFAKELILTCERNWLPGTHFTYKTISPKLIEIRTDHNPNKVLMLSMNTANYPGQCRLYAEATYVYLYFE